MIFEDQNMGRHGYDGMSLEPIRKLENGVLERE